MNVFIAGGSSSLGRSVIKVFKDRGDSVTATCCTKAPATDVQWIQMDVTDPDSVSRAFEAVDRIDCLINLFGVFTEDVRDWEKVFDINVTGLYRTIEAARPHLHPQSSIINTASINAFHPGFGNTAHYDASKGAVAAYTISLASELAPIRVNALAPGLIDAAYLHSTDLEVYYRSRAKLGRLVGAEELAHACTFLCDNKAITGQVIVVDCGFLIG